MLEARENLLKLLPTYVPYNIRVYVSVTIYISRSIGNLRKLQRLDLGNNEIEELVCCLISVTIRLYQYFVCC